MASETEYAGSVSNVHYPSSPSWGSTGNAVGSQNGSDASVVLNVGDDQTTSDWLSATMNNFSASSGIITSVQYGVYSSYTGSGATGCSIIVQMNDGGGWCSGHTEALGTSDTWETGTCTHHTWTFSNIDSMQIRARVSSASGSFIVAAKIDSFRGVVNYTTCTTPGTPGAPSLSGVSSTKITVNKPSDPTGSPTEWQARTTDNVWTSSWTSTATTSIDHTGLSAGTTYTYDVRFRDTSACTGSYGSNASITTDDVPDTPGDPTFSSLSADARGGFVTVSSNSPDNNGSSLTDVQFQIDDNTSFNNANGRRQTWTKGSAPSNPQTHNFTRMDYNVTYYARARYENGVGWSSYNSSPYNSTTTWGLPSTSSAPTISKPADSTLRVTKPTTPSGNGESVDNWNILKQTRSSKIGNLLVYLPMDFLVSGEVHDLSGNGIGGKVINGTETTGKYGSAVLINAANEYVDMDNSELYNLTTVTISAWIKLETGADSNVYNYIFSNTRDCCGSYSGMNLYLSLNTSLRGQVWNGTNVYSHIYWNTFTIGTWYHVAWSFNNSTRESKLYVNGSLVSTTTLGGSVDTPSSYTPTIGALASHRTSLGARMSIDEFRIYDAVIGDTAVDDIYQDEAMRLVNDGIALGTTTWDDVPLPSDTTFYYSTSFQNGAGFSEPSALASGTPDPGEFTKTSDSRISDEFEFTETSDARILHNFKKPPQRGDAVIHYPLSYDLTDRVNGRTLTASGDASFTAGKFAGALKITDAGNGFVSRDISGDTEFDGITDYTASIWMRYLDTPVAFQDWLRVIGANGCCQVYMTGSTLYFSASDGSGEFNTAVSLSSVSFDTDQLWHHFAFRWDSTEERMRIYIDGVLVANTLRSGRTPESDPTVIYIGDGEIDAEFAEFQWFNSSLTPQEIANLAAEGITSDSRIKDTFLIDISTTPDAHWNFNTTNTSTDVVGSFDLSATGTITYQNSGAPNSYGYAETSYSSGTNYLSRDTSPITSINEPFTIISYVWWDSFSSGISQPMFIIGNTNSCQITFSVGTTGNITLSRRSTTSSTVAISTGLSVSTSTWHTIALGHDPDNNAVFIWVDDSKYSASDLGDMDFTGTRSRMLMLMNRNFSGRGLDGRMANARFYTDRVVNADDIDNFTTSGELSEEGITSDSRIKNTYLIEPTSDSRILQVDNEFTRTSDSSILDIFKDTKTSDTRVKNTYEVEPLSDTRMFVPNNEISMFGVSRIKDTFEITDLSDSRILDTFKLTNNTDSRIFVPDNEVTKTGDSAVFYPEWGNIEVLGDARIRDIFKLTTLSDTTLVVVREEIRRSDSVMYRPEFDVKNISSDTAVFVAGYDTIDTDSNTTILQITDIQKTSLSKIKNVIDSALNSDSAIYRSPFDIKTVSSDTRIGYDGLTIIDVTADSRIKDTFEITSLSDSFIILNFELNLTGDSTIFSPAFGNKSLESDSRIEKIDVEIPMSSDTNIEDTAAMTILGDTRIKRTAGVTYPYMTIKAPSDTRLVKTLLDELKSDADVLDTFIITSLSDTLIILQPTIDVTSDTNITASPEISLDSDSRIIKSIEISMFSQQVIKKMYEIMRTSDTLVKHVIDLPLEASSVVAKTFEFTVVSNTTIEYKNDLPVVSDATVFNQGYGLVEKLSLTYVTETQEKILLSDTATLNNQSLTTSSDTYIRKRLGELTALFRKSR